MKEVVLFGRTVQVKDVGCNKSNCIGQPIPPIVNLFVKVTNACNAKCPFCSNVGHANERTHFDTGKLFRCIDEILDKRIILNRLNITGGEPAMCPSIVNDIITKLAIQPRYSHLHLHFNTNGLLASSQELMRNDRFNSISVSLHHYDAGRLSEIYGVKISNKALNFEGVKKEKLNLSCNLIKGYVDNKEEVQRMLDFAIGIGIPRIGFVGLMPVNDYCRSHTIQLEKIDFESIPRVYYTGSRDRGENCKCSNYLYNKDRRILEIYICVTICIPIIANRLCSLTVNIFDKVSAPTISYISLYEYSRTFQPSQRRFEIQYVLPTSSFGLGKMESGRHITIHF